VAGGVLTTRGGVRCSTLSDVALVFTRSADEIAFWTTVAVWGIGERVLTFRDLRSGAWKGGQDAGSYFWVLAGVIGGFAAAIALADHNALALPARTVWPVVGLLIAWVGILFRLWAVVTLGRSFTTRVHVRPDQLVVTRGPYRLVRHPSYLGLLILFCGLGLAMGDLASALVMIALPAVGLVKRIVVEEAALRAGLGDSYLEYCTGRARLIPGIW
jgi:protein-S-isoprenylcysteine O-methyltransferase Ste14